MSDLRTRIIAAVLAELEGKNLSTERAFPSKGTPEYEDEPYGWTRMLGDAEIAQRVAPLVADAVIRELGLRQESVCVWPDDIPAIRYVTEWEN